MRHFFVKSLVVSVVLLSNISLASAQDPFEYNFPACAAREFQAGLTKSTCETIAVDIPRLSMMSQKSCYDKVINQLSEFRRTQRGTKDEDAFIARLYSGANDKTIDIVVPILRRCSLPGNVTVHPDSRFLSYVEAAK